MSDDLPKAQADRFCATFFPGTKLHKVTGREIACVVYRVEFPVPSEKEERFIIADRSYGILLCRDLKEVEHSLLGLRSGAERMYAELQTGVAQAHRGGMDVQGQALSGGEAAAG